MIMLTKLNDMRFALNPDSIEIMSENPDTTIKLTNGTTYIVKEDMDTIIKMIVNYRQRCVR
ncbi:MAG: flagellar FlbD family protein [Oscillospiraceae bacterium]|jgi:flagellar protein FlbD|nr:flagellar FlbD family protein [Oscillospiraceae bacterium]